MIAKALNRSGNLRRVLLDVKGVQQAASARVSKGLKPLLDDLSHDQLDPADKIRYLTDCRCLHGDTEGLNFAVSSGRR